MMDIAYCFFVLLCHCALVAADRAARLCRAAWFWANGGCIRVTAAGGLTSGGLTSGGLTSGGLTSGGLTAYDRLDASWSVFRTLTRGSEAPDMAADLDEDRRLRSHVLMVTMFLAADGMSCPKTQTFLHARLKGFARTAPTARELARLSEKACGLARGALNDTVVVILEDFEELKYSGDEVVVLRRPGADGARQGAVVA